MLSYSYFSNAAVAGRGRQARIQSASERLGISIVVSLYLCHKRYPRP